MTGVRRRATLISADVVGRGLETVRVYRISDKPRPLCVKIVVVFPLHDYALSRVFSFFSYYLYEGRFLCFNRLYSFVQNGIKIYLI
jgi:hypothetical protein